MLRAQKSYQSGLNEVCEELKSTPEAVDHAKAMSEKHLN